MINDEIGIEIEIDDEIEIDLAADDNIEIDISDAQLMAFVRQVDMECEDESNLAFIKNKSTRHLKNEGEDGTSPYATQEFVRKNGGKIDSISVNGVEQEIDENKNVNLNITPKAVGTYSKEELDIKFSGVSLNEPIVIPGNPNENDDIDIDLEYAVIKDKEGNSYSLGLELGTEYEVKFKCNGKEYSVIKTAVSASKLTVNGTGLTPVEGTTSLGYINLTDNVWEPITILDENNNKICSFIIVDKTHFNGLLAWEHAENESVCLSFTIPREHSTYVPEIEITYIGKKKKTNISVLPMEDGTYLYSGTDVFQGVLVQFSIITTNGSAVSLEELMSSELINYSLIGVMPGQVAFECPEGVTINGEKCVTESDMENVVKTTETYIFDGGNSLGEVDE